MRGDVESRASSRSRIIRKNAASRRASHATGQPCGPSQSSGCGVEHLLTTPAVASTHGVMRVIVMGVTARERGRDGPGDSPHRRRSVAVVWRQSARGCGPVGTCWWRAPRCAGRVATGSARPPVLPCLSTSWRRARSSRSASGNDPSTRNTMRNTSRAWNGCPLTTGCLIPWGSMRRGTIDVSHLSIRQITWEAADTVALQDD